MSSFTSYMFPEAFSNLAWSVQGSVTALCCLHPCKEFTMPLLVSGSSDRKMHIWDPKKGNPVEPPVLVQTLHKHGGTVTALTSMDNQIISGSTDLTIRVWRSADGRAAMLYPMYEAVQVLRSMPTWIASISQAPMSFQQDIDNTIYASDGAANTLRIAPTIVCVRGPENEPYAPLPSPGWPVSGPVACGPLPSLP